MRKLEIAVSVLQMHLIRNVSSIPLRHCERCEAIPSLLLMQQLLVEDMQIKVGLPNFSQVVLPEPIK
jgi:hypothetical protein